MRRLHNRILALILGLGIAVAGYCGLESVTHISDLNASWPLGSDLASTADDHIRNIKTALKTDFNNISGVAPISSSSTIPVEGIYVPSANALGFASNTLNRGTIASTGAWSIAAPTSGIPLSISGVATTAVLKLLPADSSSVGIDLLDAGANTTEMRLSTSNTLITMASVAGGGTPAAIHFNIGATTGLSVTAAAGVQGNGTVNGLTDMTPDQGTYTITYTGMTAGVTGTAKWVKMGNIACLTLPAATGTSNATTMTGTGSLPSGVQPATTQWMPIQVENTTAVATSIAFVEVTASSSTLTFSNGSTTSMPVAFTGSGTKGIPFAQTFCYQLT